LIQERVVPQISTQSYDLIYSANVVNFYNATGSLARFENKNILFYFEKRSSVAYYNAGVVAVNSKVVGLALGEFQLSVI
jgi:hypothetical protein